MKLVEPSLDYRESFEEALKEFDKEGDGGFWNECKEFDPHDVAEYVSLCKDWAQGKNLIAGRVPASTLWLIDNEEFIGHCNIRHELTDHLRTVGGHIGYYIRPSKRGQGYGKSILKLALEKAKAIGLDRVLVTCEDNNERSRRVIEANGGMYEGETDTGDGTPKKLRFWVNLTPATDH